MATKTIITKEKLSYYQSKLQVILDKKGDVKSIKIGNDTYTPDPNTGMITFPDDFARLRAGTNDIYLTGNHDDTGGGGITEKLGVDYSYQNDSTNPRIILDLSSYNNELDTYVRNLKINLPTKEYVDSVAGNLASLKFEKVDSLPATGQNGVIYLVANTESGSNAYDEYAWINRGTDSEPNYGYELFGATAVDLTGYVQETDLVEITTAEIDEFFTPAVTP